MNKHDRRLHNRMIIAELSRLAEECGDIRFGQLLISFLLPQRSNRTDLDAFMGQLFTEESGITQKRLEENVKSIMCKSSGSK